MSQNVINTTLPLTTNELRILGHLPQGLTNKQIAREEAISPETVKCHLTSIFRKLDVAPGSGARVRTVAVAKERGLV